MISKPGVLQPGLKSLRQVGNEKHCISSHIIPFCWHMPETGSLLPKDLHGPHKASTKLPATESLHRLHWLNHEGFQTPCSPFCERH